LFLLAPPLHARNSLADLIQKARKEKLSQRREWRLLLHYSPGPFGLESEASSSNFFLSPQGRRSPQKEIEADIREMFGPDIQKREKSACRFPARYAWIKSKLALKTAAPSCPAFEAWKKELFAPSVSLIFASAYMGNPASLYGHTFLRLNQENHGSSSDLLDPTLNFAAATGPENGFSYAAKGLLGLFPGYYSVLPYARKVEEYNDFESRDIWEYKLNLDSSTIDLLLTHLWELNHVSFPYYFFNKNCSYQLLKLIEVADPRVHLIDHWPLYVIPADTIRAVKKAGLVQSERYRPALLTRAMRQFKLLNHAEKKIIPLFIKSPDTAFQKIKSLSKTRQALILDIAAEDLQYQSDYRKKKEAVSSEERYRILAARAGLGIPPQEPKIPAPTPPEEGHPSARLSMGQSAGSSDFTEFDWRPGLHDLLDPPAGYNPDGELAMMNLDVRRDLKTGHVYLHNLDLVKILALPPFDTIARKPSWNFSFGLKTADELAPKDPWNANYFGFRAGGGASFDMPLVPWHQINYVLVDADAGAGQIFRNYYRLGGGGKIGTVADLTTQWRLRLEGFGFGYFLGDTRADIGAKIESQYDLTRAISLRLKAERNGPDKQAGLNFLIYY
jgi:hypothetical protein